MIKKSLILGAALGMASALFITPVQAETKEVKLDGSSTVYPISEAVAEEFGHVDKKTRVTVGVSGTGGGFKKFVKEEIDISGASRPIKDKEIVMAKTAGINFIELPVAYDGISVVANPKNTWADSLTTEELKQIWQTSSTVTTWKDVRAAWPDEKIKLYGPGADSGTFEYFTKKINGKAMSSRSDYTASEDDNVLVHGISGDKYALGYFGYGYYAENKDKLKLIAVSHDGKSAVAPSPKTIEAGTYKPLSRPVFIYVNAKAAKRPEVKSFVDFYLKSVPQLSKEVGYVPFSSTIYSNIAKRWAEQETGTAYSKDKSALKSTLK